MSDGCVKLVFRVGNNLSWIHLYKRPLSELLLYMKKQP
jgi:hypothetical protein